MRRQAHNVDIPEPEEEEREPDREEFYDKEYKQAVSKQPTLITPLFFLVSTTIYMICYYQTLEGGDTEQWLHTRLYRMAMWMVTSDVIFVLSIMLALSMEGAWRKGMIAYCLLSSVCLFALDQGNTVQNHGAYNTLAFIVFLTPMLVLGMMWRTCFLRLTCKNFILVNFTIVFIMLSTFGSRVAYVKHDWNKGLLGLSLDTDAKYFCHIEPPPVNAMAVLPYRTWNFWAGSHKCPEMNNIGSLSSEGLLTVNCPSQATYTILPAVDKWTIEEKLYNTLQSNVLNRTQTLTYSKPVQVDAEAVVVDCGADRNAFVRSIEKYEASERVKEYNKKHPVTEEKLNLVFLNFDAVARAHFHRRFPKTRKFITDLHGSGTAQFFEFFRYHVLAPYTVPNLIAMYTGIDHTTEKHATSTTIWDEFINSGYITGSVDNSCLDWSGKYQKARVSAVDHQLVAPFCLPEVHPLHNPYGNFAGPFSILRRCLAGQYVHKYVFDYISQFITQYSNLPKFILGAFNEGHEGTGEVIGLVDDDLVEFMAKIDYNNTAVFIVSDHGLHMNIMFAFREESVLKENALGLLTAIFPTWFLEKHPEYQTSLQHNQQALVTPYDIFETLLHFANFPTKSTYREAHSQSLFTEVDYNRSCKDAGIPPHFCICNKDEL
jgi:hypothetical protein